MINKLCGNVVIKPKLGGGFLNVFFEQGIRSTLLWLPEG
jgi:hypothetical protein